MDGTLRALRRAPARPRPEDRCPVRRVAPAQRPMSSAVDLTIVVPAYNEARRIVVSLETLSDYLHAHDLGTVEVLVVVARGHDDTAELARGQAGAFDMFRVIDAGEAKDRKSTRLNSSHS